MKIILSGIIIVLNFSFYAQTGFSILFELNNKKDVTAELVRFDNFEGVTILELNRKSENVFTLDLDKIKDFDTLILVIGTKNSFYSCKVPIHNIEKQSSYTLSVFSYRRLIFFKFYNLVLTSDKSEVRTPFYLNKNKK